MFFILCYSDVIPFYIYIHISVRLHSLYNAFFSVFYRLQVKLLRSKKQKC